MYNHLREYNRLLISGLNPKNTNRARLAEYEVIIKQLPSWSYSKNLNEFFYYLYGILDLKAVENEMSTRETNKFFDKIHSPIALKTLLDEYLHNKILFTPDCMNSNIYRPYAIFRTHRPLQINDQIEYKELGMSYLQYAYYKAEYEYSVLSLSEALIRFLLNSIDERFNANLYVFDFMESEYKKSDCINNMKSCALLANDPVITNRISMILTSKEFTVFDGEYLNRSNIQPNLDRFIIPINEDRGVLNHRYATEFADETWNRHRQLFSNFV